MHQFSTRKHHTWLDFGLPIDKPPNDVIGSQNFKEKNQETLEG